MKVNRKFLRSAERLSLSAIAKDSAAQKIVSAVTAIGFVMQPVAALASTITRTDGGPAVNFNNNGRLQVQIEQDLSSNYISGIHLIKKSVEQFIRSVVA